MDPILSFTSNPSPCEYLPDRTWQLRYDFFPTLDPATYGARLHKGWRRFGTVVFRPECPACNMCRSLRVPVATFQPSESQRRAWRKNATDVTIRVGEPASTPEKLALFNRFHLYQHHAKGWPFEGERDLEMFVHNPFPTEEWCYYLDERLIAVGYVDALADGLSAIYFYYEPSQRQRSLGTFNVLSVLAAARSRTLPYVYLGYYVAGCRSLEYKARFRPSEILTPNGWERFES
jgi:leucyl-tRNA---protein transferase